MRTNRDIVEDNAVLYDLTHDIRKVGAGEEGVGHGHCSGHKALEYAHADYDVHAAGFSRSSAADKYGRHGRERHVQRAVVYLSVAIALGVDYDTNARKHGRDYVRYYAAAVDV